MKGNTNMQDVFCDDMGLDGNAQLALAKLDLNEPMLNFVTFDNGDPLEGSSSTPNSAQSRLDTEEKDARESNGGGDVDFDVNELSL